eukprot:TRINITY_DN10605_c0_g4_i1.p1 TRINITY_DN10605_c0_g4~~TRINITY_DN10605_c0_g4_i1.p1  ORF type:complete len:555 (+),score=154.25 TRINITY_DN10605_c0_g4_i1:114-1667(+)
MSLQDVLATQQQIEREQQAIRRDLEQISQRVDSSLKGDIRKLLERLDASDAQLARITGSPAVNSGNGGGNGRGVPQSRPNGRFAPPSRTADVSRSNNARLMAAPSGPQVRAGPSPGGPQVRPKRKSEQELAAVKAAVAAATQNAEKSHVWEEPAQGKAAPAAIDRIEQQLRSAIERNREYQRNASNPIQGIQAIFNKMDKNHSGKVDAQELADLCRALEFEADAKALQGLFNRYDVDNSRLLTVEEFSRSMFKLDGDSEFKAKSAIARMREVLSLRAGGFESMKAMGSQFRIIDRDHTGQLTKEELNIALDVLFSAYNVKFSEAEKNALLKIFDKDKSGSVDYNEFVRGVRGDMNDFRVGWVRQAFAILDTDGSGVVDINEMGNTYDVSECPDVKSGKVTPHDAIMRFMKHFDANSDGRITEEEFIENYNWVSASIDSDDYFELMIRNAWHITGGEGWCQNTSNLRVLVKHNNAPDEVVEVTHDLGLPRDPDAKYLEVVKRLQKQGVKDIQKVEFFG